MIIRDYFPGDPIWVQDLQYTQYFEQCSLPFNIARDLYIKAEKTIGYMTKLGESIICVNGIDHRTMQYFHVIIAADFRLKHINEFEQHLPGILENLTEDEYIVKIWIEFYRKTIIQLYDLNLDLPKKILIAAVYKNPDKRGIKAERYIAEIVNDINHDIIGIYKNGY